MQGSKVSKHSGPQQAARMLVMCVLVLDVVQPLCVGLVSPPANLTAPDTCVQHMITVRWEGSFAAGSATPDCMAGQ
jgi:hypothetical protein